MLTLSNHLASVGANNLPQFDEGNQVCVEFHFTWPAQTALVDFYTNWNLKPDD